MEFSIIGWVGQKLDIFQKRFFMFGNDLKMHKKKK